MVSISVFASLFAIPVGITSSAVGLKSCIITAGIKKYKLLIKRKKKKHDNVLKECNGMKEETENLKILGYL